MSQDFYDPGIMAVGNKCILTPAHIPRAINAAGNQYALDKHQTSGIQLWFSNLTQAREIQKEIQDALAQRGIENYWNVSTFYEYEFAKDLIQQFQSDKYLFTLVGLIILLVGCSNIIPYSCCSSTTRSGKSVFCKPWEHLQKVLPQFSARTAWRWGCSVLIRTGAALLTLKHIDSVVSVLSFLQGHEAFSAAFYSINLFRTNQR